MEEIATKAIIDIAVSYTYTCVARKDGSVWCDGQNGNGELGDGTIRRKHVRQHFEIDALCKRRSRTSLDKWAFEHRVTLHFIQPGKPMQNGWTPETTAPESETTIYARGNTPG